MGYFQSDERTYSLVMFVVCVSAVVAMAALTSDRTDSVSDIDTRSPGHWVQSYAHQTQFNVQNIGLEKVSQ